MLRLLLCLALSLVLHIPEAWSANLPAPKPHLQRINLPPGFKDLPFNLSDAAVGIADPTLLNGIPPICLPQRPKPLLPFFLIKALDCYRTMARGLLLGDDVMDRRRWARINTPFTWNAGTCMIIVDSRDETALDYFSDAEIAHVAASIALPCVANNDEPLGGRASIGIRGDFTVTVYGRDPATP
ncbi:MAG: hypothetical protein Q9224_003499 [Gallowayella concinna]